MQTVIAKTIEFALEYQNSYWEIKLEHDATGGLPELLDVTYSPAGSPELKSFMQIESRIQHDKTYRWFQRMNTKHEIAVQKDFMDKLAKAIEQKVFERAKFPTTTYINRAVDPNFPSIEDRQGYRFPGR